MSDKLLKLLGRDAEDVEVIAAVLQDAIVPLCDMAFQPEDKTFIMVVHRFCWCEAEEEVDQGTQRVCCAVTVEGVDAVQVLGIDQAKRGQMLELLTANLEGNVLNLIFAGDARIRLSLASWQVKLQDFGERWPISCIPTHE